MVPGTKTDLVGEILGSDDLPRISPVVSELLTLM